METNVSRVISSYQNVTKVTRDQKNQTIFKEFMNWKMSKIQCRGWNTGKESTGKLGIQGKYARFLNVIRNLNTYGIKRCKNKNKFSILIRAKHRRFLKNSTKRTTLSSLILSYHYSNSGMALCDEVRGREKRRGGGVEDGNRSDCPRACNIDIVNPSLRSWHRIKRRGLLGSTMGFSRSLGKFSREKYPHLERE